MNICSYVLVITHPVGMLLHEAEGRVLINQRHPNWACYNCFARWLQQACGTSAYARLLKEAAMV